MVTGTIVTGVMVTSAVESQILNKDSRVARKAPSHGPRLSRSAASASDEGPSGLPVFQRLQVGRCQPGSSGEWCAVEVDIAFGGTGEAVEEAGDDLFGEVGRARPDAEAEHRAEAAEQHEHGDVGVGDDELAGRLAG